MMTVRSRILACLTPLAVGAALHARAQAPVTTEVSIPSGANFDKANFRLWLPPGVTTVRAIALLVPGSNGDGRAQVDDTVWQHFAVAHRTALVGVQLTDKPHDQNFIEDYVNVSRGSGQALLDALSALATKTHHAELAGAPLLLWGMSAGGQFNYEFVAWKPERVIGFVVNKGGIYYTALASHAARLVPGMLFVGGKDLESRVSTIAGIFAVNRRGGALWAFASEPGAAHIVGRSRDVALVLFDDLMRLRLDGTTEAPNGETALVPLLERNGFIGDLKADTYAAAASGPAPTVSTAWLPTERVARSWRAMMTDTPFDP